MKGDWIQYFFNWTYTNTINIYDNITWKIQEFRQSASELDIEAK